MPFVVMKQADIIPAALCSVSQAITLMFYNGMVQRATITPNQTLDKAVGDLRAEEERIYPPKLANAAWLGIPAQVHANVP